MIDNFKAFKVTDKVYWVGAVDWTIRNFHGYATSMGTTYNAYIILADKITLIDTVKAPFFDEMISRIASVINPSDIDYIVSNHSEMDHTGCLRRTVEAVKPEKVFASQIGSKTISEHFHGDVEGRITPVKDGEELSLGNMKLTFMETRMLHWPDSMFAYLDGESLLFSQDAFGMHLASGERFASEIDEGLLKFEAAKYYANIIMPYSKLVVKLLEKVKKSGLDIKIVAPDHGPIWRDDFPMIAGLYSTWASQKPTDKAVIVYDTMWKSTEMMARAIGEGLASGGTTIKIMSMDANHRSDVITELLDAGAFICGSPTMNNNMFPTMADVLTYAKGLKPENLVGFAFGSYGWSGEAVGHITDIIKEMKVELLSDGIKAKYIPTEEVLSECYELGKKVSDRLKRLNGMMEK